MSRLTEYHNGIAVIKGKRYKEAAEKLARLEDLEEQNKGLLSDPVLMYGIYGFTPEQVGLFDLIEKALGFKLFIWQKTYITTGYFRRYGETTAKCIENLLHLNRGPIDYRKKPKTNREFFYRKEMLKIKGKLDAAGIATRPIIWTDADMREYQSHTVKRKQNDI